MIKKIKYIKNIRGFIDFDASLIEFQKKNIIYAPNGIGKTTISRILSRIYNKESLDDLLSQEEKDVSKLSFDFEIDNSSINNSNYLENDIKLVVFNSDYIDKIIKTNDFSSNSVSGEIVIPLGSESNQINTLNKSIDEATKQRVIFFDKLKSKFDEVKTFKIQNKKYGEIDRSIWLEFSINKLFNQDDFTLIKPVDSDDFGSCESQFEELSQLTDDNKINNPHINKINYLSINFDEVISDLKTSKKFVSFDKQIKKNIEYITKNWINTRLIETGIKKSKEKDKCLLCKRTLDDDVNSLFKQYEEYFANEESKFKQKLIDKKDAIELIITKIEKCNNELESEINKLLKVLGINKFWFKIKNDTLVEKLKLLCSDIDKKVEDPAKEFVVYDDSSNEKNKKDFNFVLAFDELNNTVDANKKIIEEVNTKIEQTSSRKTQLRQIIGKKFLHNLYIENTDLINKITDKTKEIDQLSEKLKIEKEKLPKKEISKNIEELCNTFLEKFLYLNKYRVYLNNGLLELHLNGSDISKHNQRISEGEKTMIALCYFFASSIKALNDLESFKNGIFIIDDPVNSTGYNYFFGVCNLIKHFDKTIMIKVWGLEDNDEKIESQTSLQKIIFTHNNQFFNVIRENIYKEKAAYFLLSNKSLSIIGKNQLKSEFENALINIKRAITSDDDILIGNDLRRFFETIRHFYGIKNFDYKALKKIFTNFEEHEHAIFFTVVNYYSHGNPESHTDPLPVNMQPFKQEFKKLIEKSPFKEKWESINIL